mmetsp:Transcript_25357/g.74622  ORF Transcript_25357/g.74622 Transcript_25357/m.74622 type:complete len:312 (+) Transcript_25357:1842-2777(+)
MEGLGQCTSVGGKIGSPIFADLLGQRRKHLVPQVRRDLPDAILILLHLSVCLIVQPLEGLGVGDKDVHVQTQSLEVGFVLRSDFILFGCVVFLLGRRGGSSTSDLFRLPLSLVTFVSFSRCILVVSSRGVSALLLLCCHPLLHLGVGDARDQLRPQYRHGEFIIIQSVRYQSSALGPILRFPVRRGGAVHRQCRLPFAGSTLTLGDPVGITGSESHEIQQVLPLIRTTYTLRLDGAAHVPQGFFLLLLILVSVLRVLFALLRCRLCLYRHRHRWQSGTPQFPDLLDPFVRQRHTWNLAGGNHESLPQAPLE